MDPASVFRNRRLQWSAVALYGLLLVALSLAPGNKLPTIPDWGLLFSPDKVAHFGAYGLFAVLLSVPFAERQGPKGVLTAILLAAAFGFLLEVLQGVTPAGRQYDPVDAVANLLGALLGGLLVLAGRFLLNIRSQR